MKEIMSSPVIVGNIEDTIFNIASMMKQYDIGFIPIAKGNKIVGVITDRDLVIEALANHTEHNTLIENYITHQIVSVDIKADIDDVIKNMKHFQIKRILITDNQKVVGVIALSNLLYHYNDNPIHLETLKAIDQSHFHPSQENLEIDAFYL